MDAKTARLESHPFSNERHCCQKRAAVPPDEAFGMKIFCGRLGNVRKEPKNCPFSDTQAIVNLLYRLPNRFELHRANDSHALMLCVIDQNIPWKIWRA